MLYLSACDARAADDADERKDKEDRLKEVILRARELILLFPTVFLPVAMTVGMKLNMLDVLCSIAMYAFTLYLFDETAKFEGDRPIQVCWIVLFRMVVVAVKLGMLDVLIYRLAGYVLTISYLIEKPKLKQPMTTKKNKNKKRATAKDYKGHLIG